MGREVIHEHEAFGDGGRRNDGGTGGIKSRRVRGPAPRGAGPLTLPGKTNVRKALDGTFFGNGHAIITNELNKALSRHLLGIVLLVYK